MQIDVAANFNYQTFFMVAAQAGGPVGVFVAKRTVASDGVTPAAQQEAILMKDEQYRATPPLTEAENRVLLAIHYESDLASFKPELDLVVVRNSSARATFGTVRLDRGAGFPPNPPNTPFRMCYGWLHRALSNEALNNPPNPQPACLTFGANPRKGLEGDAAHFTPDPVNKYKLPTGFSNNFFNGTRMRGQAFLQPTNRVEFDADIGGVPTRIVTIPPRPNVTVKLHGATVPAGVSVNLDTVIYDESVPRFMLTWRTVFPWNDDYHAGVLEVRN